MTETETLHDHSKAVGAHIEAPPQPQELSGLVKRQIQKTEGGEE
jgi:hypothetical protein